MLQRTFGRNGPLVSILGFGGVQIGERGHDEGECGRLLNTVVDLGINLIDTARAYGNSESLIGKYISHRRKEFILSTKVGYDAGWHPDWTYESVIAGINQALVLMRTDYLDIVHLHSCGREILEQGSVILALEEAKRAGKVRMVAYSGENEALDFALSTGRFDSIQTSVNICDQRGITNFLPRAKALGLGVIAKRPIANTPWKFTNRPTGEYAEGYWERFQAMGFDPADPEWTEIALRFTAFTPGVTCSITGTADIGHIRKNLNAIEKGPLPEETVSMFRETFRINDHNWIGLI